MTDKLKQAHKLLVTKKPEIKTFFQYYMFEKEDLNINSFMDSKLQFMHFIRFCLKTRQRFNKNQYRKGYHYFYRKYENILVSVKNKNIEELKRIVYSATGVGQKIGSLIIEMIYLYSDYADEDVLLNAYLPIDTHVKRILEDSFKIQVPKVSVSVKSDEYINFQEMLKLHTSDNKSRIYFDYLWFIGKMFCNRLSESDYNRGYKLCNICWIKKYCQNSKWE